jgi:spore germination cell wall hydrolase CwlJ-like protein
VSRTQKEIKAMNLRLGRDLLIYWPVLLLALLIWMQPLPAIAVPPSPIPVEWNDTNNRDRHFNCISRAIYWEARGQSRAGQIAVGQVILNRANDRRFPADVCDVVYQRRGNSCQFTWACTNRRTLAPSNQDDWHEAQHSAQLVLSNMPDLTRGALYFHDTSVVGWHHLRRTTRIDNHIFYKDR